MLLYIVQAGIIIAAAPLVAGIIKMSKARLQNRRGPGVLQVYFDIYKLLAKDSVVSPTVSWLFLAAPYVYFAAAAGAAALIPLLGQGADLFVVIYLFALGRFFLALASLDAGSAFGGMGGSREMFLSVLIEPALLLALMTLAINSGSTNLSLLSGAALTKDLSLAHIFAAVAFLIVLVAETGRIPVDNPDTHLELTMVHEGMTLEYSGRFLGLIVWASAIKQLAAILLFGMLFLPLPVSGAAGIALVVLLTALILACVETFTNKMRLFRVPGFLAVSGLLSLLALVAQ
ncbi:MAG: NADH-quinone oxidoreductase subunit H [Negativicutes bacterium]|nr:NADH-quinone oxidoreductase subunit H [Negativicutes bacterium]